MNNKALLGNNIFTMGNWVPEILGGLSPLPSFKNVHDELISASSRTCAGNEAFFSSGAAELVGSKYSKLYHGGTDTGSAHL